MKPGGHAPPRPSSTSRPTSTAPTTGACSASRRHGLRDATGTSTCSTVRAGPGDPDSTRRCLAADTGDRPPRRHAQPLGPRDRDPRQGLRRPCPPPENTLDCIPADGNGHTIGTVAPTADGRCGSARRLATRADGRRRSWRTYDPTRYRGQDPPRRPRRAGASRATRSARATEPRDDCTKVFAMGFRNPFRFACGRGAARRRRRGPRTPRGGRRREAAAATTAGRATRAPARRALRRPRSARPCTRARARRPRRAGRRGPTPTTADASRHRRAQVPRHDLPVRLPGHVVRRRLRPQLDQAREIDGERPASRAVTFATTSRSSARRGSRRQLVLVDVGSAGRPRARCTDRLHPGTRRPSSRPRAEPDRRGAAPGPVLDGAGSSDPDGDALTYAWDFGDGRPPASEANPSHLYTARGDYTARLRVTDDRGSGRRRGRSRQGQRRPRSRSTIDHPPTATYRAGEEITITGSADRGRRAAAGRRAGMEPAARPRHPQPPAGRRRPATASRPRRGPRRRLLLPGHADRARLGRGDRQPDDHAAAGGREPHAALRPPGAPLSYVGRQRAGPVLPAAAVGYRARIAAPATFARDGHTYRFRGGRTEGTRSHVITVPGGVAAVHGDLPARRRGDARGSSRWPTRT